MSIYLNQDNLDYSTLKPFLSLLLPILYNLIFYESFILLPVESVFQKYWGLIFTLHLCRITSQWLSSVLLSAFFRTSFVQQAVQLCGWSAKTVSVEVEDFRRLFVVLWEVFLGGTLLVEVAKSVMVKNRMCFSRERNRDIEERMCKWIIFCVLDRWLFSRLGRRNKGVWVPAPEVLQV